MCTRFLFRTWRQARRIFARPPIWVLLALGLANLVGGLAFGLGATTPATRILLDVLYANFGIAAWAVVVYAGAAPMPVRSGAPLAARTTALALGVVAMLTVAGLVAVGFQMVRGHWSLEPHLYIRGLYLNFGWNALHLVALAVFVQAAVGAWRSLAPAKAKWLGMAATAGLGLGANLAFEHPLLRFGAPISPWSDMNGYGPFLGTQIAVGIYWTAFCVFLLATAHMAARRRRPSANAFAPAWAALVVGVVAGGWVLHRVDAFDHAPQAAERDRIETPPQPTISRLDLAVDIHPEQRRLRSRGTVIVVNRHPASIPDLHFAIPRALTLHALSLTGVPTADDIGSRRRSYRLNRPLAPGETLKIEFDAEWTAHPFESSSPRALAAPRLLGNGTFATTADIVPALGYRADAEAALFDAASRIAFRVRMGTALEQIAVAPGTLVREWKENGRRYFEYRAEQPIPPLASFHSARYAIVFDRWQGVDIEVYHHPPHRHRVPRMIAAARHWLHCRHSEALYPYRRFRIVEVPDYQPLVRPPGLLAFGWRRDRSLGALPGKLALAGVLPHSELASVIAAAGPRRCL